MKNLVKARKWAEGVRQCVSKCKKWSHQKRAGVEKVHFDCINELLSSNAIPCNEPRLIILKVVAFLETDFFLYHVFIGLTVEINKFGYLF